MHFLPLSFTSCSFTLNVRLDTTTSPLGVIIGTSLTTMSNSVSTTVPTAHVTTTNEIINASSLHHNGRSKISLTCIKLWNSQKDWFLFDFYSTRNARIASAVLATAILSVRLSVCLSVCQSVTHRYCVKTTARSTVQFAPLDSKMCLVL